MLRHRSGLRPRSKNRDGTSLLQNVWERATVWERASLAILFLLSAATAWSNETLVAAAKSQATAAALSALSEGADVDAREADGTTALHWAAHYDDLELVRALIAAGADVSLTNDYGATPMSEAAVVGNVAVLEALLEAGADVDSPNAEGQTALMIVARTSNLEAARLLLEHGAKVDAREQWKEQTALMWAAAEQRPEMVALLLEHGADANARSKIHNWERQVTAEPRAKHLPSGGLTPLLFAAREGCAACAEVLVAGGADVDLPDPDAVTPLLAALLNAHFATAKFLIEHGANVNKWDWWGRTPLYAAVDYNTIPHGGRPDRPSLDRTTSFEMIATLLAAGANPNPQMKLLQPYRDLGADRGADSILGIGVTPLIRAAKAGDTPVVEILLEHGALPDLPNADGLTPLMAATGLRSSEIDTRGRFKTEAEAMASASALLAGGADINARDRFGQTALHGAAFRGWSDLVKLLAANGANLTAADLNGYTPIDAAMGRMRSGGRAASVVNVYEDTAAVIEELIAAESL
ncbi:MAG TPA: ankyrin repeat domain-containing protein [Gammaproteobacteria bacterium]